MVFPALILVLIFAYGPMWGIIIAFQNYKPWLGITGSQWVGLKNFVDLFTFEESSRTIVNTFVIASLKIVFNVVVPFVFALLLNEVRSAIFKRSVQTIVYLPHFLSWVMLGAIFLDMFSISGGLVNRFLGIFGISPIYFLGDSTWFIRTVVVTDVWKSYGFSAIIYLAALTTIDPTYYEASMMDGANRWQQTIYISIPVVLPIVTVVTVLALGGILNAGFDQIFNLYNPLVLDKGDIIDTYVYRAGLLGGKFSFATAVGLFKSVVSLILVSISYWLAYKFNNYRIF
jgi:putative aldouronate transport system permease protein